MRKSYIQKITPFIDKYRNHRSESGDQPTPPAPASLTQFSVGQIIKGFDFGNVQNGDTNAELDAWLLNLPVSMEPSPLIVGTSDTMLMAYHIQAEGIDAGVLISSNFEHDELGDVAPVYSTSAFELEGIVLTKGYQNLTNGKIEYPYDDYYSEIITVGDDEPLWNGVFVGAVEVEPGPTPPEPGDLTPFEDGDIINQGDKIKFDTSKGSELASYLASLTYPEADPTIVLLEATPSDPEITQELRVAAITFSGVYLLIGVDATQTPGLSDPIWNSQTGWSTTALDENGCWTIATEAGKDYNYTVNTIYDGKEWNGIFVGKGE